jgi:two-component system response regulator BaeR
MTKPEVLIVEDEYKIARLLADYLERDGFAVEMQGEGTHAVETIKARRPAFVILDLMLPGKDGLSICTEVRRFSDVPIMMLTAKVDEIDRLLGLQIGADDYVCKPFSAREVVARVRTILRRVEKQATPPDENTIDYSDLHLSLDRFLCEFKGVRAELTPVEFRLLWALTAHPGRIQTRESLMRQSYTDDRIVSDRTIDTHVKNLRRKLAEVGASGFEIRAVYGVGYKIESVT